MKKLLFWVISLTWGFPMTLIGAIITAILKVCGCKQKVFHGLIYTEVGEGWGGFNAGAFFFVSKDASDHTKRHEAGHGLQNIMLGFLTPFLVHIPSAIRYWYREYLVRFKGLTYNELPSYDAIWFEGGATQLGDKYFKEEPAEEAEM